MPVVANLIFSNVITWSGGVKNLKKTKLYCISTAEMYV